MEISEIELDEVAPLLYGSGAGALGWWRLRQTSLQDTASAEFLHQAYRLQLLQSGIHEEKIAKVFQVLRNESVEPILVKGWSAAGLYPDRGLRPYGDIDLVVQPHQFKTVETLLKQPLLKDCWVDLHKNLSELDDRPIELLFERSQLVRLREGNVRILSAEDHLALLAVHLLKHGAWRPLWLCDIGAAVENRPSGFDWTLCLGRNRKRAGWIATTIQLAQLLLGARIEGESFEAPLPDWLIENVLRQWQTPFALNQPPMSHPIPMSQVIKSPGMFSEALRQRWPNPILATISVNGTFNRLPRLPYQLGNLFLRAGRFMRVVPRVLDS